MSRLLTLGFILLNAQVIWADPISVVTENYPPFNYLENGRVKGENTEIVRKILDKAGIAYTIEVLPWPRAYDTVLTQPDTAIYTVYRLPSRESDLQWVCPLGTGTRDFLYRLKTRTDIQVTNLEQAKSYAIGCGNVKTAEYVQLKALEFPNIAASGTQDNTSRVEMLFLGRFDLLALEKTAMESAMSKEGKSMDEVVAVIEVFHSEPYLGFSKTTRPETILKVRKAYQELVNEGVLEPSLR